MRLTISAFVFASVLTSASVAVAEETPPTLDLMPVPAQIELGTSFYTIDENLSVYLEGDGAT
ncbi:MAG: hypothetical protein IFK91_10145, partial [Acidobacteria bacterium]|nr:hypothetical protein [Candidatus Sulfomarinibacter sp. MAG AM1]